LLDNHRHLVSGGLGLAWPTTGIQQKMYLDVVSSRIPGQWTVVHALALYEEVDLGSLRAAVGRVFERHEALRCSFHLQSDGELVQVPRPAPGFDAAHGREPLLEREVHVARVGGAEAPEAPLGRVAERRPGVVDVGVHRVASLGWVESTMRDSCPLASKSLDVSIAVSCALHHSWRQLEFTQWQAAWRCRVCPESRRKVRLSICWVRETRMRLPPHLLQRRGTVGEVRLLLARVAIGLFG
jgi:hypothetical protein